MEDVNERVHKKGMPKIIREVKENIILQASDLLKEKGGLFSMRTLAQRCGIAPGTIYNYFPDKNAVLIELMVGDWHRTLDSVKDSAENARSLQEGLLSQFEAIEAFTDMYIHIWRMIESKEEDILEAENRHRRVVDEISSYTAQLIRRFTGSEDTVMAEIITELFVSGAVNHRVGNEHIRAIADHITGG